MLGHKDSIISSAKVSPTELKGSMGPASWIRLVNDQEVH